MDISEIGKLSIKYNLEDFQSENKQDSVFFAPSSFTITSFETLSNGSSLFEELDAIPVNEDIKLRLNFTTDSGFSWTDFFSFDLRDVSYDTIKRTVEVEARSEVETTLSIRDIMNNYPIGTPSSENETIYTTIGNRNESYDCLATLDFIRLALQASTNTGYDIINRSYKFDLTPRVDGQKSWVVTADLTYEDSDNGDGQVTDASSMLYRLASLDGAVVGALMGRAYFVNRLDRTNEVTLTLDDVTDVSVQPTMKNYFMVRMVAELIPDAGETYPLPTWNSDYARLGNSDGLNTNGIKSLSVYFNLLGLHHPYWSTSNDRFQIDTHGSNITQYPFTQYGTASEGSRVIYKDLGVIETGWENLSSGDVVELITGSYNVFHTVESVDPNTGKLVLADELQTDLSNVSEVWLYTSEESDIAEHAVDSYSASRGAEGNRKAKMTILDIDRLLPDQSLYLDSSFPNALSQKAFRPRSIEYDIMTDKIEVEVYEID